jgi:hypothetical protein
MALVPRWMGFRFPVYRALQPNSFAANVRYLTRLTPEALHVSMRTGVGLLRSARHEWMALILAIAIFLLTSDFFSIMRYMTLSSRKASH